MRGRVYKSTGSWYGVKAEDGRIYQSRLRGKFRNDNLKVNNPIAVGDFVEIMVESVQEKSAVITEIHDRENYIIRKSTRKSGFSHILASNLDQAIVLATMTFPRTSQGFIDRFLVSAESFRIPGVVIFNKADIYKEKDLKKCRSMMELYNDIGYETHLISVLEKEGLDEVHSILKGKTSLIAGHSGVGKSTLLNAIVPHINQQTGDVSKFANKGTHTTTFAEMFDIDAESLVIDTPGIKELGLVAMETEEIGHYFPEMRQFLGECKFNNCTHTNEPSCVVLDAIEAGEIDESRYLSYLSILEDYDSHR